MPLRVALITPFGPPSVRGNAITVARIARGLTACGVEVQIWDRSRHGDGVIEAGLQAFAPGLVHAFHAWRVGPLAARLAGHAEIPLVVTLTGTDANHDLVDPERAGSVRRVLESAARIVVFDASIAVRVTSVLPEAAPRIVRVPQAADLALEAPFDLDAAWPGLPADRLLFTLAAGIRPVKQPRLPLAAFDMLTTRHRHVRLLYAGPVIDVDEGRRLEAAIAGRPWARYVGTVPHGQMASLIALSDVVLNCSLSEGGMANSVLEALASGRAVLAADIEGNRSLIAHDVSGLLFRDQASLEAMAERLVVDHDLRARLGATGRLQVSTSYPPEREIEGYLAVYHALAPVGAR
jgi:glycosyltransferase involved in cell wall biosynthesis